MLSIVDILAAGTLDLKWHDLLAGQYRSTVTLTISSAE